MTVCVPAPRFLIMWPLGILTHVFMLLWQELYPLAHPFSLLTQNWKDRHPSPQKTLILDKAIRSKVDFFKNASIHRKK